MKEKKVEDTFMYRLVKFFHRVLTRLAKKFNQGAIELNYLLYQMNFGEREDDIYVVSFPKSGTTKMQMILYQLTTDGSMDFEHIDDVSPWLKNDAFENRAVKDLKSPRLIKSHEIYDNFDKETKGKIIYVYRDGRDVAVSKFYQERNYKNPDLTFEEFMKDFFKEHKYNWFIYHRQWMINKKNLDIFYVSYEEMKADLEQVILRLSHFLDIKTTPEILQRALERSSFAFMKEHEEKFGVRPSRQVFNEFIRKGKSGQWKEYFNEEDEQQFKDGYKKYLKDIITGTSD